MRAQSAFTIDSWDANGRASGIVTGTPGAGAFIVRSFAGGDIDGRSEVLFIGAFNEDRGSGTYVAVDSFEGAILGRTGTASFWHANTMTRGRSTATDGILRFVPDSGTGELAGIRGTGRIVADGETHSIVLDVEFDGDGESAFEADVAGEARGAVEA